MAGKMHEAFADAIAEAQLSALAKHFPMLNETEMRDGVSVPKVGDVDEFIGYLRKLYDAEVHDLACSHYARQFFEEMQSEFVWDLLPWRFLHDLYAAWMSKEYPSAKVDSLSEFKRHLLVTLRDFPEWSSCGENAVRTGHRMDASEPLIVEYGLKDWRSKSYRGSDIKKIAVPDTKDRYRGLVRVQAKLINE